MEELQDPLAMNVPETRFLNAEIETAWEEEVARRLASNPPGTNGVPWEEVKQLILDPDTRAS